MHAYGEEYLYDAMMSLGECIDHMVNVCGNDPDQFFHLFIESSVGYSFSTGHPKYVCGMSGAELAQEVLIKSGLITINAEFPPAVSGVEKSPEYWAGWVYAYTQWKYALSWKEMAHLYPMSKVIAMYHPYHEASEDKFADLFFERICANRATCRRLQEYRKRLGLSQSQLAKTAEVNLRTLQQYETGAKNLRKASYETVLALANALRCRPEQLFY